MKNNNLTPSQDLLVREFWEQIAVKAEALMPSTPAYARQSRAICLLLLNYDLLPGGRYVKKGTKINIRFGSNDYSAYKCQWEADRQEAYDELKANQIIDDLVNDTPETSASESTEDTEVRETILPEDVS